MNDNPKLAEFIGAARELRDAFVWLLDCERYSRHPSIEAFDRADAALREEQEHKDA